MTNQKLESWKRSRANTEKSSLCEHTALWSDKCILQSLIFTNKNTAPHQEYGWEVIKHKNISVPEQICKHGHTLR